VVVSGMEADDAIGIDATTAAKSLIVTIDKDLLMIPGYHYNFVTKSFSTVTTFEADRNFFQQMLSGDAIDNIPGIPMVGKIKAKKALAGAKTREELEAIVRAEYKVHHLSENYYNEMHDLLWIRRENGEGN
jgi:5'-3' exonuclease